MDTGFYRINDNTIGAPSVVDSPNASFLEVKADPKQDSIK
jgi:hypothetical protein